MFLFDEPLSNLDAKLRVQMRAELQSLHQRLRTTSLFVTHDQIEAMTLAQRMIVGSDAANEWNLIMATAILAMLPPALVVMLMQRWFVKGLVETEK